MTLYACAQCGCTDVYREYCIGFHANQPDQTKVFVRPLSELVKCEQCCFYTTPVETDTPKPHQQDCPTDYRGDRT